MKKFLLQAARSRAFCRAGRGPAEDVKIGFVTTFSGPNAVIGNDMRNSFELALDHLGRKIGGLPVEVIYEDDQVKPEVGKQKTEKLIESDKVDFVVGYHLVERAAGLAEAVVTPRPSDQRQRRRLQIAGELCSPYSSRPPGRTTRRRRRWAST